MKYNFKRMLALVMALLLATPTFTLAEAPVESISADIEPWVAEAGEFQLGGPGGDDSSDEDASAGLTVEYEAIDAGAMPSSPDAPADVGAMPSSPEDAPADAGAMPSSPEDGADVGAMPSSPEDGADVGAMPSSPEDGADVGAMPSSPEGAPADAETPAQPGEPSPSGEDQL